MAGPRNAPGHAPPAAGSRLRVNRAQKGSAHEATLPDPCQSCGRPRGRAIMGSDVPLPAPIPVHLKKEVPLFPPATESAVINNDLASHVLAAVERIAGRLKQSLPGFAGLGLCLDDSAPAAGYRLTLLVLPEHLDEAKRSMGESLTVQVDGHDLDLPLSVRRAAEFKSQARRNR